MLCGWLQYPLAYSFMMLQHHDTAPADSCTASLLSCWQALDTLHLYLGIFPPTLSPTPFLPFVLHSPVDGINRGICHSLGDHKKARGRQKLVNYCWHHALGMYRILLSHSVCWSEWLAIVGLFLTHSYFHSLYPSLIFHSVQLFSPVGGPGRRNTRSQ